MSNWNIFSDLFIQAFDEITGELEVMFMSHDRAISRKEAASLNVRIAD